MKTSFVLVLRDRWTYCVIHYSSCGHLYNMLTFWHGCLKQNFFSSHIFLSGRRHWHQWKDLKYGAWFLHFYKWKKVGDSCYWTDKCSWGVTCTVLITHTSLGHVTVLTLLCCILLVSRRFAKSLEASCAGALISCCYHLLSVTMRHYVSHGSVQCWFLSPSCCSILCFYLAFGYYFSCYFLTSVLDDLTPLFRGI